MWRLCIKDDEIDMQFEIKDWRPLEYDEDDELIGYPWCTIDMPIKTVYLDYNAGGETLDRGEVLYLRDELGSFLDGTIKENKSLDFIEPVLEFYLLPEHTVYNTQEIMYENGSKTYPARVDMKIHFWIGHRFLGSGVFVYPLYKKDVVDIYHYLQLVTGVLSEKDDIIRDMIEKNVLVPGILEDE